MEGFDGGSGGPEAAQIAQIVSDEGGGPEGAGGAAAGGLAVRNVTLAAPFGVNFTAGGDSGLLNDDELAAGQLVAGVVAQPSGGAGVVALRGAAGNFSFAPAAGWSGEGRIGGC
jgi:hypothetical protein